VVEKPNRGEERKKKEKEEKKERRGKDVRECEARERL
jgi:hypothetical protein